MPVSFGSPLLLVFVLGPLRCALPAESVEKVHRAVEITKLPGAPEGVLGLIDVHGTAVPVFDLGPRLDLPPTTPDFHDVLVVVRTPMRRCAVLVNAVQGLERSPQETLPLSPQLRGVAKTDDGLVLIYNLERFLSPEDGESLDAALEALG